MTFIWGASDNSNKCLTVENVDRRRVIDIENDNNVFKYFDSW